MVHSTEPHEILQKFFAEGRLQPGKVLLVRDPTANAVGFLAPPAEDFPGLLTVGQLDAAPDKVSSLGGQRQVLASSSSGDIAIGAVSLIYHGQGTVLVTVSREPSDSSSKRVTQMSL